MISWFQHFDRFSTVGDTDSTSYLHNMQYWILSSFQEEKLFVQHLQPFYSLWDENRLADLSGGSVLNKGNLVARSGGSLLSGVVN